MGGCSRARRARRRAPGSCSTQTDRDHCGACGNVCPAGNVCSAGACGVVRVAAHPAAGHGRDCVDPRRPTAPTAGCAASPAPPARWCSGGAPGWFRAAGAGQLLGRAATSDRPETTAAPAGWPAAPARSTMGTCVLSPRRSDDSGGSPRHRRGQLRHVRARAPRQPLLGWAPARSRARRRSSSAVERRHRGLRRRADRPVPTAAPAAIRLPAWPSCRRGPLHHPPARPARPTARHLPRPRHRTSPTAAAAGSRAAGQLCAAGNLPRDARRPPTARAPAATSRATRPTADVCGNACPAGQPAARASPAGSRPAGQDGLRDAPVSTATDRDNCGGCGVNCPAGNVLSRRVRADCAAPLVLWWEWRSARCADTRVETQPTAAPVVPRAPAAGVWRARACSRARRARRCLRACAATPLSTISHCRMCSRACAAARSARRRVHHLSRPSGSPPAAARASTQTDRGHCSLCVARVQRVADPARGRLHRLREVRGAAGGRALGAVGRVPTSPSAASPRGCTARCRSPRGRLDAGGTSSTASPAPDDARVLCNTSTFGAIASRTTANFQVGGVVDGGGNDLMVQTDDYSFGFRTLLGARSLPDVHHRQLAGVVQQHLDAARARTSPAAPPRSSSAFSTSRCASTTTARAGSDCNENAAVVFAAAECCWSTARATRSTARPRGSATTCRCSASAHHPAGLHRGHVPLQRQRPLMDSSGECYEDNAACKSRATRSSTCADPPPRGARSRRRAFPPVITPAEGPPCPSARSRTAVGCRV